MNTNNGIFIGTVVANSDVAAGDGRALGRVLVVIKGKSDMGAENFNIPRGANLCKSITREGLQRVRDNEVWAYVAQPNIGGGATGGYNATADKSTPPGAGVTDLYQKPPGKAFGIGTMWDSFVDIIRGTAGVNANAVDYSPDLRSDATPGLYSVPAVGATVAVQFVGGNRGIPVIVGTIHGEADIAAVQSVIGGDTSAEDVRPGYPLASENVRSDEVDGTGVPPAKPKPEDYFT